jgi:peptide/nickel transport system substrate-binding protein
MQQWEYNWNPIGTGPFKMSEWVAGDHIVLVKNKHYRDYPEKPHIDEFIVRIIPSREAGITMIQTGEIDFLWDLIEPVVPVLQDKLGVVLNMTPGIGTERLVLNLADPSLDAADDPIKNPHPILGDLRVRRAIELAINKEEMNQVLLHGAATVGTKEYNIGWPGMGCDIPESVYDPAAAAELLSEAGFTDMDGDGVRECSGCLYAEDDTPLRLKLQTTTGNELREQVEQLIIEYWGDVGVDGYIENVPSSVLFASWASGSFITHGQFDIVMFTSVGGLDPHISLNSFFGTDQMPTEANNGLGFNISRWVNPVDDLLKAAGNSADISERRRLYCAVMQAVKDDVPHIYLYDRAEIHATREGLMGYEINIWENQTWNAVEWYWDK